MTSTTKQAPNNQAKKVPNRDTRLEDVVAAVERHCAAIDAALEGDWDKAVTTVYALTAQLRATVAGIVGVFTLLFLAQRLMFPPKPNDPLPRREVGAVLTVASGFTSFISHAGGPPLNAYLIPLRLSPIAFTATVAYFFFVVNLSKWIPYAWLGLLDLRNMATSLMLMPLAPIGVWVGVRIARRIDARTFYLFIYAGMLLAGLKLVWDGFFAG